MNRHDVVIRRIGRVDRNGKPVPDSITETIVRGCILAPRASTEVQSYSDTVLTEHTLLAPAGADIVGTDTVVVDGITYDVVGDPSVWSSPFENWQPGQQVALSRRRG